MSVTASDIIFVGADNHAENDTDLQGGSYDLTTRVSFTQLAANDTFDIVSDAAGDTSQTITITGRLANGAIDTEDYSLNGTTTVNGAKTFERLLKVVVDSSHAGIITVSENSGSTTVATLDGTVAGADGTAVLENRILFYDATANAAGGADKLLYSKFFVGNQNTSNALLSATIELTNDPSTSGIIDFDLEASHNQGMTVANRTTEPAGSGMLGSPTFDDSSKSVPSGDLGEFGSGYSMIGVWVRLDLDSPMPAEKVSPEFTISGSTT